MCIDTDGLARVYGDFPTSDDNAYFIQSNCEVVKNSPETCNANTPLTWNKATKALKVYQIKGTQAGTSTFDMKSWNIGTGGAWQDWSVANGALNANNSAAANCFTGLEVAQSAIELIRCYPNPVNSDKLTISSSLAQKASIIIISMMGEVLESKIIDLSSLTEINLAHLSNGVYFIAIKGTDITHYQSLIVNR